MTRPTRLAAAALAIAAVSSASAFVLAPVLFGVAKGHGPEVQQALGPEAQPVAGDVLLADAAPQGAYAIAAVRRDVPVTLAKLPVPGITADLDAVLAQHARAAGQRLSTRFPATAAGTEMPSGLRVFAGAPVPVPPYRPTRDVTASSADFALLRPAPRPQSVAAPDAGAAPGAPLRPLPRPTADAAPATAPMLANVGAASKMRPLPRPAADAGPALAVAAVDAPVAPTLRPRARPGTVALARLDAERARPVARPATLAARASLMPQTPASQDPQAEVVLAAATIAPSTPTRPEGLAASPRPELRPAALLRRIAPTPDPAPQAVAPEGPRVAAAPAPRTRVATNATGCSPKLTRGMPNRPRGAATGSVLASRMGTLQGASRDDLITRELLAGNLPDFLRELTPVTVSGTLANGQRADVTVCVTPDYLALGSDKDFIRVPMGLPAAAQIADRFGFLLPTTRMVDAIYAQAGLRLAPRPMNPGAQMSSTSYFLQHNRTVEGQTHGREGMLTAGQKKDLVLTNRLRRNPGRVAIYGWHRPNGQPIQPLSTVHGAFYSDYSHGVRLVSQTAFVNGRAVALADLLADPAYASILTGEGPIPAPERLMASLYR
ncbi:MAG: hypothetical protein JXJ18_09490 [Rhodobacteraceae bacterium]|nr:hypothetical protein [Paracoccaceae bacterium]